MNKREAQLLLRHESYLAIMAHGYYRTMLILWKKQIQWLHQLIRVCTYWSLRIFTSTLHKKTSYRTTIFTAGKYATTKEEGNILYFLLQSKQKQKQTDAILFSNAFYGKVSGKGIVPNNEVNYQKFDWFWFCSSVWESSPK